jgi:hypothetical protein
VLLAVERNKGGELEMRKASLVLTLFILLVSFVLLSALSNILSGYPAHDKEERTPVDKTGNPAALLFKVSPTTPKLYWSTSTADYYTGYNWIRTTKEQGLREFPQFPNEDFNQTDATVFTVDINMSQLEVSLPRASSNSALEIVSANPFDGLSFQVDDVAGVYKAGREGVVENVQLVYRVLWHEPELDDKRISLENISDEIRERYLQLPEMSSDVWELAKSLEDSSYSVLDQVLFDVDFLRTGFTYDTARSNYYWYSGFLEGSDVSSYIHTRKGVCIDAATALAVILRIQKIPARISLGYKSEEMKDGKLLYYATGAHAVTEAYLLPYGWVQFDATPPVEEAPIVKVTPFKQVTSPNSRLFYQLSITNRGNITDDFWLRVKDGQEWTTRGIPTQFGIEPLQTAYALLEITVPDSAHFGDKDLVKVTVASASHLNLAVSCSAIVQVEDVLPIPTATSVESMNEAATRGNSFWINGTVLTENNESVNSMNIFVLLTRSKETEGIIVGRGHTEQGNFQIISALPSFLEIGAYRVLLISVGTTQYAPSESESTLIVRATTSLVFSAQEEFLLGHGAIYGGLSWDNKTGFADAPIMLEITSLTAPTETWQIQELTFKDGTFRIENSFDNEGQYEVKAAFLNNEFVLGSNATCMVTLKRGLPTINVFGEPTAIRGEIFNINGTIGFEDMKVQGEPVTVYFDDKMLTVIESEENGSYVGAFLIDPEEKLGLHNFTVAVGKDNASVTLNVLVKSKTTLTTQLTDVDGGAFLLLSASLSDDHGQPIKGAEIALDGYGLSHKTDENGNLRLLLDNIAFWPQEASLTAKFEGSSLHLPSATQNKVDLKPTITLLFLVPLVSSFLVITASLYHKFSGKRREMPQLANEAVVLKKRLVLAKEHTYKSQASQPLKISLLDILSPFPNVWGINEEMHIEIAIEDNILKKQETTEVKVLIDGENAGFVSISLQSRSKVCFVFVEKGEHTVRAILPATSWRPQIDAEIGVRIVDYTEENVRLYKRFLEKLPSFDVHATEKMTAREIESLLLKEDKFDSEGVDKLTMLFEKAEYSNHMTARRDYETMYLSLKELNIDVE